MILITGLPLFAKRLADDLQSVDPSTRYIALDTYNSSKDRLKFILLLPFAKTVISMNGVTDKSGSLDWVLRFRKKLVMQWMGTDILNALDRAKKGNINRRYVEYASNFCDAQWMQEELKEAGIAAAILHFKHVNPALIPVEKYDDIRVLSYVAKGREQFYGLDQVVELAELHPGIVFEIVGTTAEGYNLPANMKAIGWVSEQDVAAKMWKSAIFLRLTEHDGFSASVTEALSYGAEVLWTFPFPPAIQVDRTADLTSKFAETIQRIKQRDGKPNSENAAFARTNFTREAVMNTYLKMLNSFQ